MSLKSTRATARDVREAVKAFHQQRDQWADMLPLIDATLKNSEVSREVLCRGFFGRLRWLVLGK